MERLYTVTYEGKNEAYDGLGEQARQFGYYDPEGPYTLRQARSIGRLLSGLPGVRQALVWNTKKDEDNLVSIFRNRYEEFFS